MKILRARWLLPIAAPPITNGWVAVEDGRIAAMGGSTSPPPDGSEQHVDGVILPGLVNAHTHLELSYLEGVVPPSPSFGAWVSALVAARRQHADPVAPHILAAARDAIARARAAGTALVGDVSNTLATVPLLDAAGMPARVMYELLGLDGADPAAAVSAGLDRLAALPRVSCVRVNLTPHAPYTVPPAMFEALRRTLASNEEAVVSVHVGESPEECEFLRTGAGALAELLRPVAAWTRSWTAPGCGPVEYMDRLGLLTRRFVAVHGVQLTDGELRRLQAAGAALVTCPRSNRWTGVGDPDVERFYASGVRVAVGTDSLASVDDLDVFAELARMRALAPRVPAAAILESATRIGAEVLGFGAEWGTIEPGRRADLLAVRVPAGTSDVEEYLLSGITPADVEWASRSGTP